MQKSQPISMRMFCLEDVNHLLAAWAGTVHGQDSV